MAVGRLSPTMTILSATTITIRLDLPRNGLLLLCLDEAVHARQYRSCVPTSRVRRRLGGLRQLMSLTISRMYGYEIHWPIARGMLILFHFIVDYYLNDGCKYYGLMSCVEHIHSEADFFLCFAGLRT